MRLTFSLHCRRRRRHEESLDLGLAILAALRSSHSRIAAGPGWSVEHETIDKHERCNVLGKERRVTEDHPCTHDRRPARARRRRMHVQPSWIVWRFSIALSPGWPPCSAQPAAVPPILESLIFESAPCAMRNSIIARWPLRAA